MYKCIACNNESEYPGECCNENMTCSSCQGAGCLLCEEDKKVQE